MIILKKVQLSESEIFDYLTKNCEIFIPSLESRLDVREYSRKLYKYATHFCAFDKDRLKAFSACYFNDEQRKTGYISSFSVMKEYQGLGISSDLLNMIISYAREENFKTIQLEVRKENEEVMKVYSKKGFIETDRDSTVITMELRLS